MKGFETVEQYNNTVEFLKTVLAGNIFECERATTQAGNEVLKISFGDVLVMFFKNSWESGSFTVYSNNFRHTIARKYVAPLAAIDNARFTIAAKAFADDTKK